MRPNVPDQLGKRIDEIYEEAGYNSKTEFINDAVRRRIEEVEDKLDLDIDERTW